MIRTKLGLLGLCAVVLGMMAISASSAQAALSWLILPSGGGAATELKAAVVGEKDSEFQTLLTHLVGLSIEISCTNFELTGVNLEAGGTLTTGGKVKFTGCKTYSLTAGGALESELTCNPHSAGQPAGTIESNNGKGSLVLHTFKIDEPGKVELKEVLTKIEPETVEAGFAKILTEGCALPESNKVNGVLYVKDNEGFATTHKVKHLIVEGPLTSLFVGADNEEHLLTSIDGSAWVKLGGTHNGLSWSGMDA